MKAGVLADYRPVAGAHDEMVGADGAFRPHWREVARILSEMPPDAVNAAERQAARMLAENGVTYNVFSDPRSVDRPWEIDAVPLVLSSSEWEALAQGIAQRARLLNRMLGDFYGPQRLLSQRVVRPEMLFANPAFLRPCHGIRPAGGVWLHQYAADLVRGPDGRWVVVADRAQAPLGLGYALENRIVTSRLFAGVFRQVNVRRLGSYFRALRASVLALAPKGRGNPRVVVLTPGSESGEYFEHAYLARYLGYDLVEGQDLTTRNGQLYLKTLAGLRRVDVIVRRVDDDQCDPLELRPTSFEGVAGLVQAAHAGTIGMANALGAGVAEAPAWMEALPDVCRELLGEELALPSTPTWWCGSAVGRAQVLEGLGDFVVRPAFTYRDGTEDGALEAVFGGNLDPAARDALAARVRNEPHRFVGQPRLTHSTAPTWRDGTLRAEPFVLRVFAVASEDAYAVAPSGLALLGSATAPLTLSMQTAAGSKDVWVLSDRPEPPAPLLAHPGQSPAIRRGGVELTSRVADNLFWLGRLAERCEDSARLFRTSLARVADAWGTSEPPEVDALLGTLDAAWRSASSAGAVEAEAPTAERQVLDFMLENHGPAGFRATAANLHDVAWLVRDRLSADAWRILDDLDRRLRRGADGGTRTAAEGIELAESVILGLASLAGLATENMTRGPAWRFFDLGRRIERAIHTVQLIRGTLVDVVEDETAVLRAVLEVADSAMTFRSRYRTRLAPAPVIDLVLLDESNPRSVAFQLARIDEHVRDLGDRREEAPLGADARLVLGALTQVRMTNVERLCKNDGKGRRKLLDRLLDRLTSDLPALSDSITREYFTHVQERPRMADQLPDAPS